MEYVNNEKERASAFLFVACWIVYMMICMSKTNYGASIAYIVKEGIFSKSDSGIISASFYLLYGFSQLFGGNIADRFSPFKVLKFGIIGSVITNVMLIFTNDFWGVLILWSLTGLIQFGVWPATAKIIAGVLMPVHKKKASVYITLAIGFGGMISYMFITPVLEKFGWGGVFVLNVILLVVALVILGIAQNKTEAVLMDGTNQISRDKIIKKTNFKFMPLFFASGMFIIMFFGIAQAMLDNGVKSWVPTMMMESYHISPQWASMQTSAMYICNITGIFLVIRIFRNIKSPVLTQVIYFLICLPLCALMLFIGKLPVWLISVVLIISTTVIYGMTNLSVRIASAFEKFGYSATISGITNAFVCLGVVISNFGYGALAEYFGWNVVTLVWLIVCIVAVVMGIPAVILWKKFINEKVNDSKGEIL